MSICLNVCCQVHHVHPPDDGDHLVFSSLLLCGTGFLLPFHSFVLAVDFFHAAFPGSTIVFDISLIYILTALLAVLLNNLIMHSFSLTTRIMFGYLVSLGVLVFLVTIVLCWDALPQEQTYGAVLAR